MLQPTTACRFRHLGCRPTKGILWQAVPVALLLGYMGCRWLVGHPPHPRRLHPPLRRLDSVLSTTFSQLEREIRFGCSGEIQLFTGTNPVTELVATRRRGATPCGAAGYGRRLDCDCASLLVTICSMITLCSASDSHHPVSTISFGIKGTYTISPLKRD